MYFFISPGKNISVGGLVVHNSRIKQRRFPLNRRKYTYPRPPENHGDSTLDGSLIRHNAQEVRSLLHGEQVADFIV